MPDYQHFISIVWWYIQYCHYFSMPVFLLKEKKDFHISHVLPKPGDFQDDFRVQRQHGHSSVLQPFHHEPLCSGT